MLSGRRRWRHLTASLAGLASITLVAGLTLAAPPASAAPAAPDNEPAGGKAAVEQQVLDELAADDTTSYWVRLQARADLSAAEQIDDWVARGQYVYDQLTSTAEASQAELVAMLDSAGVDYQTFWISNAVKVTGSQALLDRITGLPGVDEITADRVYRLPQPSPGQPQDRINAVEWGIDRIGAPQVWSEFGVTGEGIVVANMDSGVQFDHPALVEQYRGNTGSGFDHNYNWFDPSNVCGNPSLEPCDNNGHGTHTMGTMVGDDGGDNQIGVAPGAQWIATKGCELTTCSRAATAASGEWLLAPEDLQGENPDPAMRPHVINNSWGSSNGADTFFQDIVAAWVAAGQFPSWSNGNDGPGCGTVGAPGSYVDSYGVGAFNINNEIAGFSSRGAAPAAVGGEVKPNISAPGVDVRSSVPTDGYAPNQGTSMAAPHLSGSVALMWSAAVALQGDIDGTRALLDTTAIDTEDLTCGGTPENNNVWGEGRLDAFAAVQQSPRGATGTLEGTVRDADSGDPIDGATVTISGPVDRERTTGPDGTYSAILPVGTYQVEADAFGFEPQTAQATVAENQTTTQDFDLEAVANATITGTVTDGSGHGWPLYARIEVGGAPVPDIFTDPASGAYSFDVPEGTTVTLTVNAISDGYDAGTREITAQPGGQVEDFALTVATSCTAPGYEFVETSGAPEHGSVSTSGDRTVQAPSPAAVGDGSLTTTFASNNGFAGNTFDLDPIVPLFVTGFDVNIGPAGGEHTVTVYWKDGTAEGFDSDPEPWNVLGSDVVTSAGQDQPTHVDVGGLQILPGTTYGIYVDLESYPSGTLRYTNGGPTTFSNDELELTTFVGKGNPAFSGNTFTFRMWNGTAHYDLGAFECSPVAGGLLVGNARDANTGAGLNGATITSDNEPTDTTTTFATPDDPNQDDGLYILFSSLTGTQPFTATTEDQYGPDTQTPDVVASDVVEQDFHLPAGQLTIEPAQVEAEVRLGQSADRAFTVTNTGTAPAEVELVESGGDFEILGGPGTSSTAPRQPSGAQTGGSTAGATPAGATTPDEGDREVTMGTSGLEPGLRATPKVPAPDQNEVTITHSASQEIVSLNSVACTPGGGLTTENGYLRTFVLEEFDIGGDFAVTDVSFGIETINGPPHPVTVNLFTMIDPNGDVDYPNFDPIGTTDVTLDPQELTIVEVPVEGTAPAGSTLVVEMETPDMVAQGGGLFVGSNPDGQTDSTYLRSESCQLTSPTPTEEIGQPDMHWVLNVTGEVGGDVPWLTLDPEAATLQPGESVTVTVGMDSGATEEQQPGTYTAGVAIGHDTPYQVPGVDVTMNVTPPNNWGKITGSVTGVDCQGEDQGPLAGAIVQVNGKRQQVTLLTGADGGYAHWLPVNNNPLTLIVATGSHVPQVREAELIPRQTVTEDFTLHAVCVRASGFHPV